MLFKPDLLIMNDLYFLFTHGSFANYSDNQKIKPFSCAKSYNYFLTWRNYYLISNQIIQKK